MNFFRPYQSLNLMRFVSLGLFSVILLVSVFAANAAWAQTTTYSHFFSNGTTYSPGSAQWDDWDVFRTGAPTSGIQSVTISGSLDATGRTCSDPALAQQIMDNFRTATGVGGGVETSVSCGGFLWMTGNCALSGPEIEFNVETTSRICSVSSTYVMRPRLGNGNWGGVNSASAPGPSQTMTLSYTETASDPLEVTSTADTNTVGTLRYAINHANANASEDNITFAISGGGVHTIALTSALPDLTDNGINIDGITQTGASCGQLTTGTQHTILIELNGAGAGVGTHALTATGDNITLKGLSIYGFGGRAVSQDTTASLTVAECLYIGLHADGTTLASNTTSSSINPSVRAYGATFTFDNSVIAAADGDLTDDALSIDGVNGATITGNLIGLKADGTTDGSISDVGINVTGTSTSIVIGGATAATRNVVANAGGQGVIMTASGTGTIIGNYIGTDRTGLVAKGNHDEGIRVADGTITIGGTSAGEGNVISATTADDGIFLTSASVDVTILGNLIGVGSDGTTAMGNSSAGIDVGANATAVQIGDGTAAGSNVIKNNGDDGVELAGSSAAAIVANEIYNNGNMAIELLSGTNHNLNDVNDVDTGGNDILNFPEFNSVSTNGATTIDYDFDLDVPSHGNGYRIDFFKNTAADSTGSGEGEVHLGFVDIVHGGGDLNFTGSFTASTTVDVGSLIAATTTRKTGASSYDITSEYSVNDTTTSSADPLIVTNTNDSGAGSLRDAITYANANAADDDITFNISGLGPHVISPTSVLPAITDNGVSIDGSTQSSTVCGGPTNSTGGLTNRKHQIVLFGSGHADHALIVNGASDVIIKALTIGNGTQAGLYADGADGLTLLCNHFGASTDTSGDVGNTGDGARINDSDNVVIGDGTLAGANVFGFNGDEGLELSTNTPGNGVSIRRNFIGVGINGVSDIGNGDDGLTIGGWSNVTVGDAAGGGNIISGNNNDGLYIILGSSVTALGNFIGTNAIGTASIPNGDEGVQVEDTGSLISLGDGTSGGANIIAGNVNDGVFIQIDASVSLDGNSIGVGSGGQLLGNGTGIQVASNATAQITGNQIANHTDEGIEVISTAGTVAIYSNNIYNNGEEAIDLNNDGVTANDSGDVDAGANDLLNFPVINEVAANGTAVEYDVDLDVPANTNGYRIEFFKTSDLVTQNGEGETYLGFIDTGNHAGGNVNYTGTFTASETVSVGNIVSATTTRKTGASSYDITSEFSGNNETAAYTGPDGVEDTDFPADYWDAQYYQGYNGIVGSSWPSDSGLIYKGEAYWGVGDGNVVPIYPNGTSGSGRWSASETPTSPNDPHPSYVGGVISGAYYQIDLRRKAPFNGTLEFGGDTNDVVDDAIEVFINGTRQYAYFPSGGNPDPRPSDSHVAVIPVNANDDVLVRFVNLGGIGGARFTYSFIENSPLIVTSTADTNTLGTLRYAMNHANANTGDDAITFNITGTGPHTITAGSALPAITDANVSIDGTTQSGAVCGDLWGGTAHTLKIRLDSGSGSNPVYDGLSVNAAGVTIKGLSITRFRDGIRTNAAGDNLTAQCNYAGLAPDGTGAGNYDAGIAIDASDAALIGGLTAGQGNVLSANKNGIETYGSSTGTMMRGNFIGTDPAGTSARANTSFGIVSDSGTVTWADVTNNLLSGNTGYGIYVTGGALSGSSGDLVVAGNYIGVDRTGNTTLPNLYGMFIIGSTTSGIRIGGTTAPARNIISGNTQMGIALNAAADFDIIGNYIGLGADGTTTFSDSGGGSNANILMIGASDIRIGNADPTGRNYISGGHAIGIWAHSTSMDIAVLGNHIGLDISGAVIGHRAYSAIFNAADGAVGDGTVGGANIIAGSTYGVLLFNGAEISIVGNSIYDHTNPGIDLEGDLVTANDSGDGDPGPNDLLNFPVINSISAVGTTIYYDFDLDTVSNLEGYRIDFYSNSAADASLHGEGETHLGFIDISHTGGDLNFTGDFVSTETIAEGTIISATTTRKTGGSTYDVTSEFSLNYTSEAAASLTAAKSVSVFDPTAAGLYALPGNDIISSMLVTNAGSGAADADTIVIIDEVPSEMIFYNGDMDDGGPATNPVYFTQTGGAGLTFTYGADAAYSDSMTRPTNMAGCTYTPSVGYDSNVTYVCFNPKGAMAAGDPDPTFTIQFRARIK